MKIAVAAPITESISKPNLGDIKKPVGEKLWSVVKAILIPVYAKKVSIRIIVGRIILPCCIPKRTTKKPVTKQNR